MGVHVVGSIVLAKETTMLISRRTTIKGLVASTFAFHIPYALIGAANAGKEHPIMRAIRKSEHGFGRVKRCKNDPGVAKFTVDMTEYAKDGLSITSDYGTIRTSSCKIRRYIGRSNTDAVKSVYHFTIQGSGFDIWAPQGTPVIAAIDGRISISHFDENSGNGIRIQSENAAIWPEYLHLGCFNLYVLFFSATEQHCHIDGLGSNDSQVR